LKIVIQLILVTLLFSCNHQYGNTVNQAITHEKIEFSSKLTPYKLHDVFQNIKSIPLETNEKSFITSIEKIRVFNEEFYILDAITNNLYVFNKNGKFMHKIGSIGSGPNEFQNIVDFEIDYLENSVVALDIDKRALLYFKPDGEYITTVSLPFQAYRFSILNNHIALYTGYYNDDFVNLVIVDKNMNIIKKLFPYPQEGVDLMKFSFTGHITNNGEQFIYSDALSSNIHKLDIDGVETNNYEINFVSNTLLENDIYKHDDFFEKIKRGQLNYLRKDFEVTSNNIVFEYNEATFGQNKIVKKLRTGFYLKKENELLTYKNFPTSTVLELISGPKGLINQTDFISIIEHDKFKNYIERQGILDEEYLQYYSQSKSSEELNPILFIYSLK